MPKNLSLRRSLQGRGTGLCAHFILGARAARDAKRPDKFSVNEDGKPAFHRNGAVQRQDDQAVASAREPLVKHFRGTLENGRRSRLVLGNGDTADLRLIQLFEIDEKTAGI